MQFTSHQIEAITQRVLRELSSRGVSVAVDALGAESMLGDKVVTEDTLAAANAAGQTISVPAGAVITPSGRDYIRRNAVTISCESAKQTADTAASGVVIVIGNHSAATSAASAAKWNIVNAGCEFDSARKAIQQSSDSIVCCGGEASITACLLNRDSRLRTAVVSSQTDVPRLIETMSPQVVCLESAGWSVATLLKLFRTLPQQTKSEPADWKELRR